MNRFHEERRQRLTLLLDNEEWRAAEVPKELQEAVDDVLLQVKSGFLPFIDVFNSGTRVRKWQKVKTKTR